MGNLTLGNFTFLFWKLYKAFMTRAMEDAEHQYDFDVCDNVDPYCGDGAFVPPIMHCAIGTVDAWSCLCSDEIKMVKPDDRI